MQQRILESEHYLDGRWILGQGTIYPDTIESGGSAKADLIKTHHNRVAGIQKLIDEGRIIEPLSSFYKDEVRAIGRELGSRPNCSTAIPSPAPASRSAASARTPKRSLQKSRRRLDSSGALRRRARRLAHLPPGAGDRSCSRFRRRSRRPHQPPHRM